MLSAEDIAMVYEYSKTLTPICGTEELEAELMAMARPRRYITPMFLTRSLRRRYLEFHLEKIRNVSGLHPVVVEMPTYSHLKEWVSSGATLAEQG